ncbi:hypothetical protein BD779DRAFT_1470011 [Infundibulicybe gibba]|nr:hypothetical protein BD779DRAFT_1470011 [Infundibulicybe gibba]
MLLHGYELFVDTKRIGVFLGVVLLGDTGLALGCLLMLVSNSTFDSTCIVTNTSSYAIIFGTQCLIWSMTLWKRGDTMALGIRMRIPLLDLLVRDGSIIFVCAVVIVIIGVPCSIVLQAMPHLTMAWCTSLPSITACRLIINPLLLAANESESQDITGFTSCEDLTLELHPSDH